MSTSKVQSDAFTVSLGLYVVAYSTFMYVLCSTRTGSDRSQSCTRLPYSCSVLPVRGTVQLYEYP